MAACNINELLRVLAVLILCFAIVTGTAGLVAVSDESDRDKLVQTCDGWNREGSDCVKNLNGEFAVAVVAFMLILFSVIAILGEFRVQFVCRHFYLLFYMWGRGFWQYVIGIMALGVAGDMGIAACIMCLFVGTIQVIFGVFLQTQSPAKSQAAPPPPRT